jgi:hypothetical protein
VYRDGQSGERYLREEGDVWKPEQKPTLEERIESGTEPLIWSQLSDRPTWTTGNARLVGHQDIDGIPCFYVVVTHAQSDLVQHVYIEKEGHRVRRVVSEDGQLNAGPATSYIHTELRRFDTSESVLVPNGLPR